MAIQPLIRDVLLRDGSTLRLRTPGPQDFDDIKAFYDELSPESRYMRFHGFGRTDTAARAYAEADGVDRVALIGRHGPRVVAAAGFDLLREPGAAEVAFAVADDFQRRGAATRLLEQLAEIGAERGLRRFDAEVLADNRRMLNVFRSAGFSVQRQGSGGEVTVSLDIARTEAVQERISERDHVAAVASLRPILAPNSIAVVGASSSLRSVGGAVLANVIDGGFRGVAAPVHSSGGVIRSMRSARNLDELQEVPELVVIAAPAAELPDIALRAAEKGADALLVLAPGFHDPAVEGRELEEQLLEIVRNAGMRMVGPNSLGVLNTDPAVSLNATFAGARVPSGRLAICSQSGAIGIALLGHAAARKLGVSSFASLGNRADVSTNDLLELWEEDERTAGVVLYVETFGNPERFSRIAQRVARRKPILAVKGRRAAEPVPSETHSHTAAALRGDAVVDALFYQAGVLRFRSGTELFNAAQFFESQPLPKGRRIGIVSNSAGLATLAADACGTRGLFVGRTEDEARNPLVLEINAGVEEYATALRELLADTGVDALMAYYVDSPGGDPEAVLETISDAFAAEAKPVVASVVRADGLLPENECTRVPNFTFPESCASVLARAADRRAWLSRPLGQRPQYADADPEAARGLVAELLGDDGTDGGWLTSADAAAVLATHNVPLAESHHCTTADQAVAVAAELARPIALKAEFPTPEHAGDIDAVLLGLEGAEAVRAGWRELEHRVRSAGRVWGGAVVQRLVAQGADLLVGAVSDPDLGPVMAVALGGRQAGLGRTAAFRVLPETDVEAGELIDASESVVAQLDGFRGRPALDREALRELILRFALLVRSAPEIVEADLNPVRCTTNGCVVLDWRLRIERRLPRERIKTW